MSFEIYTNPWNQVTDPCRASGQYCDAIAAKWVNQDNYTAAQICSQCQLGIQQMQLSSPFGYSDTFAQAFDDTTKSCSATAYSYSTPTAYALNATVIPPPTICTGSIYTIQPEDTCISISAAHNVSTYSLIKRNGLNLGCDNLPAVGQPLCLPTDNTCRTYQLDMYDSCRSLMVKWNVTVAQILAWNPMIDSTCSDLAPWRAWYLCSR